MVTGSIGSEKVQGRDSVRMYLYAVQHGQLQRNCNVQIIFFSFNRASVVRRCHYEPTAINYCSWYRGCEGFVCLLGRNNNVLDEYSSNVSSSVLLLFTHCTMDIIAGKNQVFWNFYRFLVFHFFLDFNVPNAEHRYIWPTTSTWKKYLSINSSRNQYSVAIYIWKLNTICIKLVAL